MTAMTAPYESLGLRASPGALAIPEQLKSVALCAPPTAARWCVPAKLRTKMAIPTHHRKILPTEKLALDGVSSFPSETVTGRTTPVTVKIPLNKWVTVRTSVPFLCTTNIHRQRDRLQMVGKHARLYTTQMIERQPFRDRTNKCVISYAMRSMSTASVPKITVPGAVLPCRPQPAVAARVHLGPEALGVLGAHPVRPGNTLEHGSASFTGAVSASGGCCRSGRTHHVTAEQHHLEKGTR